FRGAGRRRPGGPGGRRRRGRGATGRPAGTPARAGHRRRRPGRDGGGLVRAVNLIPGEQRRGGGGQGASTVSYVVLGVLAVELVGCTSSQSEVSRVMARLRLLHGVIRVSLASSEKADSGGSTGGGASAAASSSDCRNGSGRFPEFQVVVFFEGPASAVAATAPGA